MEMCAHLVGYGFDDADWDAVDLILSKTDDDGPRESWGSYALVGESARINLRFAQAVSGNEVMIEATGATAAEQFGAITALLDVFATYRVTGA